MPTAKFSLAGSAVLLFSTALLASDAAVDTLPRPTSGSAAPQLQQRLDHEGIAGTLVICGGGSLPDQVKQAFVSALPAGQPVVIIATASADPTAAAAAAAKWITAADAATNIFPESASSPASLEELAQSLRAAGGVWITGGKQSRLARAYAGTVVEHELYALLQRGGVIGGTSAGAAIMSKVMIASGSKRPNLSTGLDLVPGAIIDQHFSERSRLERLKLAVAENSDRFGLGIDEATAVVISGRSVRVVGRGSATLVMAGNALRPAAEHAMPAGSLADLTQLRRAARWRCAGSDPGEPCFGPPELAAGSLVIVGGGGMSQQIVDRFVELAGGSDARIVVLPTAVPRREALRATVPRFLARANIASVTMLPQSRTEEIADDTFQQALREATGIWFDGGRQWNFVDAYEGTGAIELFHDVLRRGGVIGGSSAGATIQGEYLVRGHPLGNTVMMAEGYERGFAFLPGVAIDQHFTQRRRHGDLASVVQTHPRLLGIGIDEATALVVSGSRGEVIGEHAVHFFRSGNVVDASGVPVTNETGENAEPAVQAEPEPRAPSSTVISPCPPGRRLTCNRLSSPTHSARQGPSRPSNADQQRSCRYNPSRGAGLIRR